MKVIDFGQPDFVRVLEYALQFGMPVLLENIGETIDPVMNPILDRAFVRVGERDNFNNILQELNSIV